MAVASESTSFNPDTQPYGGVPILLTLPDLNSQSGPKPAAVAPHDPADPGDGPPVKIVQAAGKSLWDSYLGRQLKPIIGIALVIAVAIYFMGGKVAPSKSDGEGNQTPDLLIPQRDLTAEPHNHADHANQDFVETPNSANGGRGNAGQNSNDGTPDLHQNRVYGNPGSALENSSKTQQQSWNKQSWKRPTGQNGAAVTGTYSLDKLRRKPVSDVPPTNWKRSVGGSSDRRWSPRTNYRADEARVFDSRDQGSTQPNRSVSNQDYPLGQGSAFGSAARQPGRAIPRSARTQSKKGGSSGFPDSQVQQFQRLELEPDNPTPRGQRGGSFDPGTGNRESQKFGPDRFDARDSQSPVHQGNRFGTDRNSGYRTSQRMPTAGVRLDGIIENPSSRQRNERVGSGLY